MAARQRIVQKYGGTSVGTPERIRAVAERVKKTHGSACDLAVVVSAMAGETNRLLALAAEMAPDPHDREVDVLVSTGEQVSTALLAIALHSIEAPAVSLQGYQVRIGTDSSFGRARIKSIDVSRVEEAFADGKIVVVAGFQGIDEGNNITTLGRGGSDTTAVALAAALKADVCEIYTDVDGVYTTDPRVCPDALKLERISYEEMLELASLGAKVLQIRSVECASRYKVRVHVRSSFGDSEGTWVVPEEEGMEEVLVSGVALDKDQAKVTLQGVPDKPGLAAKIFGPLASAGVVIDMIVQNVGEDGRTDVTFTVHANDLGATVKTVDRLANELAIRGVSISEKVGKVSVVGLGMRNHAGVAARMFELLAGENINIQMISTSEIKISVVVDVNAVDRAVNVLHKAFIGPDAVKPREGSGVFA
jgi:aspartate kinase